MKAAGIRASGFLPRRLGVLLVIAGVGFLAQGCGTILFPSVNERMDAAVVVLAGGRGWLAS